MIIGNAISPYALKRVGSGGGSVTPTDYLLRALDLDNEFIPMDGVSLVSFEGELHLIFGWNAVIDAPPSSKKTHWKSSDGGYTWTQLADFPGDERHGAACEVMGGKIWTYCGDFLTDVWTYDNVNGWVEVTPDWGIGVRCLGVKWTDGTYLYNAGGQDTIPSSNFYTDVYRSSDGITWTKIGDLPSDNVSTGVPYVVGSTFYIVGGGKYIGTGVVDWNTNIYKSTNGGVTWTTIASALPDSMRAGFPGGAVWDNKIWYLMGSDTTGNNAPGLWYTTDFTSWTQLYDNPRPRHAEQLAVQNDKLHIVAGNMWNDSLAVEKVAQTTNIAPGAIGAYSVFDLGYGATACVRVQRSSDMDIAFIGFDTNGYLDEVALLAFVGIGEGRVIAWIDQTGEGNDVNNVYADAPVICTSGAMNLENGIAALLCNGSKQLSLSFPLSLGTTHSIHVVCNMASYSSIIGGVSSYGLFPTGTDTIYYNAAGTYTLNYSVNNEPFPLNEQVLVELYRVNEGVQMFRNGVKMGDASSCTTEFMGTNTAFTMDHLLGQTSFEFNGNIQTVILYGSDVLTYRKGTSDTLKTLHGI